MTAPLYQPSVVKELLRAHGFTLKKQYGQNFLIDGRVLHAIVEEARSDAKSGKRLAALEIGPGVGTLTQALVEAGFEKVVALEKDRRLLPLLRETMRPYPQVEVIAADALQFDYPALFATDSGVWDYRFVANLPYYITTPIVMMVLEAMLPIEKMVLMVQKEVAERMTSPPGGKTYGALSVAVQYYGEPRLLQTVPASSFLPNPGVDSAVVSIRIRPHPDAQGVDRQTFFRVVKGAFAQRRKTLNNALAGEFHNLSKGSLTEWVKLAGIDPSRRGETLSIREFAALAHALHQAVQDGD